MNILPHIKLRPPPEHQLRRLARWIRELETDLLLKSPSAVNARNDTPDLASGTQPGSTMNARHSEPVKPGQIRLLHPAANRATERPVYVAVLHRQGKQTWLIAPFGRFAEPATPGEWLTGLEAVPLRVLCIWNRRTASMHAMESSWVAGDLNARRMKQALEVLGYFTHGKARTSVKESDLGPPVRHPLDPRLRYLAEEAQTFHEHIAYLENTASFGASQNETVYNIEANTPMLAAEGKTVYKHTHRKRAKRRGRSATTS